MIEIKEIMATTEMVTLARVLEILEEKPTLAKKMIEKWYQELKKADEGKK